MLRHNFIISIAIVVAVFVGLGPGRAALAASAEPVPVPSHDEFRSWLDAFKKSAISKDIPKAALDRAFNSVTYIPRVIELDRRQPEFSLTFWQYFSKAISDKRVARGRALIKKHAGILSKVKAKYGVAPRFLVAFWGLESNFGDYTGSFPLVGSLATLSYDKRRRRFFSQQLLAALEMIAAGDIKADAKSSWAGAMGNTQFIPTTYRAHAVDFDGDGRRDLWGSLPDVFASSARFLAASGWDKTHTWGREVALPKSFDFGLSGLDKSLKLKEWTAHGVTKADGKPLPRANIDASLIVPAGAHGPAFLVYQNFRTTMIWNRSILYALAVGHLSDRIAGLGKLLAKKPKNDKALSRADIKRIQTLLTQKGFDTSGADGIAGPATRRAIRDYQLKQNLPADGFADVNLLRKLEAKPR